jgi:dTDP-4-amino-4,6-dideoxygalactose transaminase
MPVPLLDLRAQHDTIRAEISDAIAGVVESQLFILGAAVERLEREVAELSHTKYAVGCASGTDGILGV